MHIIIIIIILSFRSLYTASKSYTKFKIQTSQQLHMFFFDKEKYSAIKFQRQFKKTFITTGFH